MSPRAGFFYPIANPQRKIRLAVDPQQPLRLLPLSQALFSLFSLDFFISLLWNTQNTHAPSKISLDRNPAYSMPSALRLSIARSNQSMAVSPSGSRRASCSTPATDSIPFARA